MNKLPQTLQKWKAKTSQEKLAVFILRKFRQAGFKSFIVGGYVRDLLLGKKETGAIDIATAATPNQVQRVLKGLRIIPTGLKHGTVTVFQRGEQVEITTFRTEGQYENYRRPSKVSFIINPKIDAGRRDFTINALYFNPVTLEYLDFFGGLSDIKNARLRFIGSAKNRITEDALRLMRAVRFSTLLNFRLAPADKAIIKKLSGLIQNVSAERIKQELDKIMSATNRSLGLRLLYQLGLLDQFFPEISKLAATKQSKNFHGEGDVFTHTLLALDRLEKEADLTTTYGILFHDIGKGVTAVKTRKHGKAHISFHGHQEAGESMVKKILSRLRFSRKEIDDIAWYVRHHHIPVDLPKMRRAKQLRWCLEPRFGNLLKLFRADSLASLPTDSRGKQMSPSLDLYNFAVKIYRSVRKQPQLGKPLVSGDDVMKILKIPPGPKVGHMLEAVKELQLEGKLKTRARALDYLKKKFQQKTS